MKSTKEVQDAKEELARQEQIKAAAKKRQEKLGDIAAKKRAQEKIAADKEERRLKAERVKAEREGRAVQAAAEPEAPVVVKKPAQVHSEARLRFQLESGTVMKTFGAETTLFEVAQALESEAGKPIESFTTTFPKKTYSGSIEFGQTLKEAGLVPSAVLIVR